MSREEAVRRGNTISTCWDGEHTVGCYLGNGIQGSAVWKIGKAQNSEMSSALI